MDQPDGFSRQGADDSAKTGPDFHELMTWADKFRRLGVRANADTPLDAKTARVLARGHRPLPH
jgi:phosphoenolpyruvate synthase/pyruvate phosphate dikinase